MLLLLAGVGLGIGALVVASGGKPEYQSLTFADGFGDPPPKPTRAGGHGPKLGPPMSIGRKVVCDFRPSPGEYGDAHVPELCIGDFYCTPPMDVPLGFPDNWIPADPKVIELLSAPGAIEVQATITLSAITDAPKRKKFERWRKWMDRVNAHNYKALEGNPSVFTTGCMQVRFEGTVGQVSGEQRDVPTLSVLDNRQNVVADNCSFQVSPSIPRLTVASSEGKSRRLIMYVPAYNGGIVLAQLTGQVRRVL